MPEEKQPQKKTVDSQQPAAPDPKQAAQQERQAATDAALSKQVKGDDTDPLPMIAKALDRLAPRIPTPPLVEPDAPDIRQGGLFRVGDRLLNAQGQEIRDANQGGDGKLYGGSLYDPREGKTVRKFGDDEENVG
jgi:hypothetical protein